MAKKKKQKELHETEIKVPVRIQCGRCGKRILRDYYDIVKYQIGGQEFCSKECYEKYLNEIEGGIKKCQ